MLVRIIKGIFRRLNYFWDAFVFNCKVKTGKIKSARIYHGDQLGEKVLVFKQETEERIELQDIYDFCRDGSFLVKCPEVDVWLFEDALCMADNDFVVLNNDRAFWQKYFAYNYSKNIVLDNALIKEEGGIIYYKVPKVVHNVDCAFSLIGVFAHIWSHSLSEHYIKLSVLGDIVRLSKEKVTVLVPDYSDDQLKQIVYKELNKYDVDVLVVKKDEALMTKRLYYMERPAFFTDHEVAVEIGDNFQPQIIADTLKKQLVTPLVNEIDCSSKIKLYLPRRGSYRSLKNNDEVEAYFKKQGFVFLEPHQVSLEEKVKLFNSADVVVGPYSSAFSNLIFCKPGTKVLILSNYYRAFESWLVMHKQHFGIDMLWVTGYDDKTAKNPAHCNFYIPLEKIIKAAQTHGIINE